MDAQKTSDFISEEDSKSFGELFDYIYAKDAEAKRLSFQLLEIAHKWDDIVDGEDVSRESINKLLLDCIFTVQQSPYWTPMGLSHHILNVFLRWRDSDSIEKSLDCSDDDLNRCYMLRAGIYDLFVIIAFYLKGDMWAQEIGPLVRRYYGEKLEEYKEEIRCQIRQEDC